MIAGLRQGGVFDSTVLIASLIIIAVPIFVLGFLAQFVFGVRLGIAPVTVGDQPTFARLLLPGIVLGAVSFAYVVRLTRSAVADNAHADYVRTATAKGLSRPRVVTVHILRNSLIPVVTFLGADLGALMGGAIVTEGIFNIHGVGGVLYQAVTRQEAPTVVSIVTVLVADLSGHQPGSWTCCTRRWTRGSVMADARSAGVAFGVTPGAGCAAARSSSSPPR